MHLGTLFYAGAERFFFPLSVVPASVPSKKPVDSTTLLSCIAKCNVVSRKNCTPELWSGDPERMMKEPTALATSEKNFQVVAPIGYGSEGPYRLPSALFGYFVFFLGRRLYCFALVSLPP